MISEYKVVHDTRKPHPYDYIPKFFFIRMDGNGLFSLNPSFFNFPHAYWLDGIKFNDLQYYLFKSNATAVFL